MSIPKKSLVCLNMWGINPSISSILFQEYGSRVVYIITQVYTENKIVAYPDGN